MDYAKIDKYLSRSIKVGILATALFFGKYVYHISQVRIPDRPRDVVRVMQIENELGLSSKTTLKDILNRDLVSMLGAHTQKLEAERDSLESLDNYSSQLEEYNQMYDNEYLGNKRKAENSLTYTFVTLMLSGGLSFANFWREMGRN